MPAPADFAPDVSVVLTLHREGPFLGRTLQSLEEASVYARRLGVATELVAVLDRPDAATSVGLETLAADAFDRVTVLEVDHGSLGPSRNSGAQMARGRYTLMCDGDDLLSFNAVAEMVRVADAGPAGALVFPEYLIAFGVRHHLVRYWPLSRSTPLGFFRAHPYVSRVLAQTEVFRSIPYRDVRLTQGYAYEDWHFNASAVARGHDVLTATDTILFYRQRDDGLLSAANAMSVRQIPPCPLFEPSTFRRVAREAYHRTGRAPEAFTQALHAPTAEVLDRPVIRGLVKAANAIDPGIDPGFVRAGTFFSNVDQHYISVGRAYYEVCESVADAGPFDEVFLLPFDGIGGAEAYLRHLMTALRDVRPHARLLAILGENAVAAGGSASSVPPGTTVVYLGRDWPALDLASRQVIALRLIESLAPTARLHLRDSSFATGFFNAYWPVLGHHPTVFYRFSDAITCEGDDLLHRATGFTFVSNHLARLWRVVTDTETLAERDRLRFGVWPERFVCLKNRRPRLVSDATLAARTARTTGRVLWASRLDPEKRPDLLPDIARALSAAAPGHRIDAYGMAVLGAFDLETLQGLPNLAYQGPYAGFEQLPYDEYDVFLYTSWFDGLPNVVLEAIAAGLPVIAPDVGGIREIVVDDETGVLLPPIADAAAAAEAYAKATARLLADPPLRRRLAEAALEQLIAAHSPEAHTRRVGEIFGGDHER